MPLLAILSGLLGGAALPETLPFAWVVVYAPLFLALDSLMRGAGRAGRRIWAKGLLVCWLSGVASAAVMGGWIVNTAHVYGSLPLPLAHGVNLAGYGSLIGLEIFAFLGIPFLLGWKSPRWGFFLVIAWSTAFHAITPRFFFWTFGQMMYPVAPLVQVADVVGSAGLNLLLIPLHLVLFGWVRELITPGWVPRRELTAVSVLVAAAFAGAAAYGFFRISDLALAEKRGEPVQVVGVQPNFSLKHLASNPTLSPSDRERSLTALLADSEQGLTQLGGEPDLPTLMVWPESVYPAAYFRNRAMRELVEAWAARHALNLVLVSSTAEPDGEGGRRVFGSSVHVSPDGGPPEIYNKMALIPFGETIPLGKWFPAYRKALKAWIPQIAEFDEGREFTVFSITEKIRVAPLICFDAATPRVASGMVRNGANLGLVMANLAWFGRTGISDLFEVFIRFRALETRIPFLMLSQNGRSVLLDATGERASERLGQFETGALSLRIRVPETTSFYAAHTGAVHGMFVLMLAALLALRWFPAWRKTG